MRWCPVRAWLFFTLEHVHLLQPHSIDVGTHMPRSSARLAPAVVVDVNVSARDLGWLTTIHLCSAPHTPLTSRSSRVGGALRSSPCARRMTRSPSHLSGAPGDLQRLSCLNCSGQARIASQEATWRGHRIDCVYGYKERRFTCVCVCEREREREREERERELNFVAESRLFWSWRSWRSWSCESRSDGQNRC